VRIGLRSAGAGMTGALPTNPGGVALVSRSVRQLRRSAPSCRATPSRDRDRRRRAIAPRPLARFHDGL